MNDKAFELILLYSDNFHFNYYIYKKNKKKTNTYRK